MSRARKPRNWPSTGSSSSEASTRVSTTSQDAIRRDIERAAPDADGRRNVDAMLQEMPDLIIRNNLANDHRNDASSEPPSAPSPRIDLINRIHAQVAQAPGEAGPAARLALQMIDAALSCDGPVTARYNPDQPDAHPFGPLYQMASAGDAAGR